MVLLMAQKAREFIHCIDYTTGVDFCWKQDTQCLKPIPVSKHLACVWILSQVITKEARDRFIFTNNFLIQLIFITLLTLEKKLKSTKWSGSVSGTLKMKGSKPQTESKRNQSGKISLDLASTIMVSNPFSLQHRSASLLLVIFRCNHFLLQSFFRCNHFPLQ